LDAEIAASYFANTAFDPSAIPFDGVTTVKAWVKCSAPRTVKLTAGFTNSDGATVSAINSASVSANTWTEISVAGPDGYRLSAPGEVYLGALRIQTETVFDGVEEGDTESIWLDDLTATNVINSASSVHLYRTSEGEPTFDISDMDGVVRVRLTAPNTGLAGLSFFSDEGDAMTFTGSGLSLTHGPTTVQIASWEAVRRAVSPAYGSRISSNAVSLGTDWTKYQMGDSTDTVKNGMAVSGDGLVVPATGTYQYVCKASFSQNGDQRRGVRLIVNGVGDDSTGTFLRALPAGSSSGLTTGFIDLAAGDVVELAVNCGGVSGVKATAGRLMLKLEV
jgi:hypothetical protein